MKAGKRKSGILEGCSFDFDPEMIFSALPWELRSIGIPYRPHRFDRRVWGPGSLPWGHRLLSPGCTTFAGKVDRTRCFLGWCLVEAKALAVRTQLHCEGSERKSYPLGDISRYTPQPSPSVGLFCCAIRASNLSIPKTFLFLDVECTCFPHFSQDGLQERRFSAADWPHYSKELSSPYRHIKTLYNHLIFLWCTNIVNIWPNFFQSIGVSL